MRWDSINSNLASGDSFAFPADLRSILGAAISRSSAVLRHRATIRIARRPAGWPDCGDGAIHGGTSASWVGEPRTLFIYDEYPADFPEAVSDATIDPTMVRALTFDRLEYHGVMQHEASVRSLLLVAEQKGEGGIDQPIPVACKIELYAPGRELPIATSRFSRGPRKSQPGCVKDAFQIYFHLPDAPADGEARLLLDLEAGRVTIVRLVFRPSREIALEAPSFDRYWSGTADVTVPLESSEQR